MNYDSLVFVLSVCLSISFSISMSSLMLMCISKSLSIERRMSDMSFGGGTPWDLTPKSPSDILIYRV